MTAARLRTVALLAREPGFAVLRDALLRHPRLEICAVLTHGRLPKAEGGGERLDVAQYAALCRDSNVPLILADGVDARELNKLLPAGSLDLLISLSWRYVVPQSVLDRFRCGCLNLHRGALPAYAGAIPVQRAIEAGERRVAITCHEMVAEIDAGAIHAEVWTDMPPRPAADAATYTEAVKTALLPLYAPLALTAIAAKIAGLELAS